MHRPMWVFLAITGGCAVESVGPMGPSMSDDASGGGLPAPRCGTPCDAPGQCVGCGYSSHLCFGEVAQFTLGTGSCTADGASGTETAALALDVDTVMVTGDRAGAAVVGGSLELVIHAGQHRLSILAPAVPGTYACESSPTVVVQYTSPAGERAANRPVAGRLPCSVTLTAVGELGARVEGSLSVQVPTTTGTVALSAAAFSVARVPSP